MDSIGGLRSIVLNRPKALNALTLNMVKSIQQLTKEWSADSSVRVVTIKGVGGKAFCAGGDVVAIAKSGSGALGDSGALARDFFREEYIADFALANLDIPYVALLDGITMGGGVGISVHGKFRVATEKTLFAMPETAIGLFPDVGGSFFLPRLAGALGMYLALTGARLKGPEVFRAGIATHYVLSENIPRLEDTLSAVQAASVSEVRAVLDSFQAPLPATTSLEGLLPHIHSCFGADSVEQIVQRLEALPSNKWATDTVQTMRRMSPISMKITHEQLRRGKHLSLAQCLQMEYRMTQHCMQGKDFYEGIRAVLVDKDQQPKWAQQRLEEVTPEQVAAHFAPVDGEPRF